MTTIPRINQDDKGGWYISGEHTLVFFCPSCAKVQDVTGRWVDQGGKLAPRFSCKRYREDGTRCGFADWITLGDWPQALQKKADDPRPYYVGGPQREPEQDDEV